MDGNVMLSTELDTKPVVQSLSNLKRKIVEVFKGADAKTLSVNLRAVNAEIKATEAQARKAQMALDALMSGQKTPQSVKELERELAATEKQAEKMSKGYDKMLASVEKYSEYAGLSPKIFPEAQKFYDAQAALERYEKEWEALDLKAEQLRTTLDLLKQNPQLTPEAQKYQEQLAITERRLTELRAKQEELGASAQKVGVMTRLQQNSVVTGFQHIEHRIMGLVKRVFFFTLITKALRSLRSQISGLIKNDSQLASSLAVVKGNLATAFGTIWVTALPALRALINFLAKATSYLVAFISWLTGKSFKAGQQAMQSLSDSSGTTAGNTGKIGKAAKKAAKELNRMLLPFDQMNVLSKDTADNASGAGNDGGAGGAGGAAGITWPKEMDGVMAKFEKFKDLILLIGAAFAAWKLAPLISNLLKISKFRAFVGLTALIAGIALLVRGIKDLKKNGPSVENICDIIAGALLTVGGAILLLTGATGLGAIIIAIGLVVLAFKNLYKNFKPFRKYIDGALKRIKKAFGKGKLAGFKQIGKEIILGILKGMLWVIKKIGSWIKKNVVDPIKKWFKKKFGIASPAKEMLDIGKNIALGILEGILQPFKKIGDWVKEHILTPLKEALFGDGDDKEGLIVSISTKFEDTKEAIQEKWNALKSGISNISVDIKSKFEDTKDSLAEKWNNIKSGLADTWANIKSKFEDTKESLAEKWNGIKAGLADTWANIKSKFEDTKESLAEKWNGIKAGLADTLVNINSKFSDTKETLATKWNGIKSGLSEASVKVTALLTAAWDKTKTWFTEFKNLKSKKAKKTLSVAKGKISTYLSTWKAIKGGEVKKTIKVAGSKLIQDALDAWDNLKSRAETIKKNIGATIKLPKIEWSKKTATIGPVSVDYPWPSVSWTYLAKGGVIPANKEFLAVLGDQKRGVNIETPLETMIDAFNTALQQNGIGGTGDVNVYLQGDAKQLFKVVRVEADNYTRSTGKAAFNL